MINLPRNSLVSAAAALPLLWGVTATAQTYYGSQLMAPEERAEHRAIMRNLPPHEREAYRAEHHEAVKNRAEAMGLAVPDQPLHYLGGRGPGGRAYGQGWRGPRYWGSPYGGEYSGYGPSDFPGWGGPGYRGPGYGGWGRRPRW